MNSKQQIPIHSAQGPDATHGRCGKCRGDQQLPFSFDHAFQPIVDVSKQSIFAHEALVRGPNGEDAWSVLSQVTDENRYAFDQACRVSAIRGAARLKMEGLLSINFMPNAVYQPEACIQTTLSTAREVGFPIEQIVFETLEDVRIVDQKYLMEILQEYQRFGFKTAIDDFGAGYSGLDLLADFQPDIVKIDMALVRGIDGHRPRQIIIKSIVDICTQLDSTVVAEGIETYEEYRCLTDLGVPYLQGFYFCRPQFRALGNIEHARW